MTDSKYDIGNLTQAQVAYLGQVQALFLSIEGFDRYVKDKTFYTDTDALEHYTNALKQWEERATDLEYGLMVQGFSMVEIEMFMDLGRERGLPDVEIET